MLNVFADETAKWEKITYAGIVTCTLFAAYNLSKGHPHFDEPPARSCSRFR
jgi:cytochrome c oxidase subunit 6a